MSNDDREHPQSLRELSRYRLNEAHGALASYLAESDAPAEVREELRIARLITDPGIAQRSWYGISIDPEDTSVTVGVMMRNAFEAVGDYIDAPTNRGPETRADHRFTKLYLARWRAGKRAYDEYLSQVFPGASRTGEDHR